MTWEYSEDNLLNLQMILLMKKPIPQLIEF